MKLHLHHVPAAQGLIWVRQGWAVFRRAPLSFLALLGGFLLIGLLLSLLGPAGALFSLATLPVLSLVFMLATHQVVQGRPAHLGLWALPFKVTPKRRHAQLLLGLVFMLAMALLAQLVDPVDGAAWDRLADAMRQASAAQRDPAASEAVVAAMRDPALMQGALLRFAGIALLSVPFWHAPALVHWGGHGVLQALFGSCVGLWHNRGAYSVQALAWLGIWMLCSLGLSLLMLLAAPLALAVLPPLSLVLQAVFAAGLYFGFVDSYRFGDGRPEAGATETESP